MLTFRQNLQALLALIVLSPPLFALFWYAPAIDNPLVRVGVVMGSIVGFMALVCIGIPMSMHRWGNRQAVLLSLALVEDYRISPSWERCAVPFCEHGPGEDCFCEEDCMCAYHVAMRTMPWHECGPDCDGTAEAREATV